jgi:hypothetical protein
MPSKDATPKECQQLASIFRKLAKETLERERAARFFQIAREYERAVERPETPVSAGHSARSEA